MKKNFAVLAALLIMSGISIAQVTNAVDRPEYGIKFNVPEGWKERKTEETSRKDAISCTFDKDDGSAALMLLAFRLDEVKNLTDLVYTFEKDLTLNIPKIDGEYREFDSGDYDGISAKYKDTEFTELIYYYRTKRNDMGNFAYMLRFISPTSSFKPETESSFRKIADTFTPLPAPESGE